MRKNIFSAFFADFSTFFTFFHKQTRVKTKRREKSGQNEEKRFFYDFSTDLNGLILLFKLPQLTPASSRYNLYGVFLHNQ